MDDERSSWGHWLSVALYWFVLLGLMGEFGSSNEAVRENPMLPWMFLAVVAFGIWRVVRKWRKRRRALPLDED
jgi:membrane protein DedA with SNARE-associated domain